MEAKAIFFDKAHNHYFLKCKHSSYWITGEHFAHPIGSGSFGVVYKASKADTNNQYIAIKKISKSSGIPINKIREEISMSFQFKDCYNLVYALDYTEDLTDVYIVMPLYDCGTLSKIIYENQIKSEMEAIEYLRQICYGLNILHQNGIIHRDLKTDNILIAKSTDKSYAYQYYLSISDFGLSKHLTSMMNNTIRVGTCLTRAPEVTTNKYSFNADVYSIGCIFYKMLTHKELFTGSSEADVVKMQNSFTNFKIVTYFKKPVSAICLKILEGCLQLNPNNRFTSTELFNLLEIENLYNNYSEVKLDSIDTNQSINVQLFNRKKITQVHQRMLKFAKLKQINIKIKTSIAKVINRFEFPLRAKSNLMLKPDILKFKSAPPENNMSIFKGNESILSSIKNLILQIKDDIAKINNNTKKEFENIKTLYSQYTSKSTDQSSMAFQFHTTISRFINGIIENIRYPTRNIANIVAFLKVAYHNLVFLGSILAKDINPASICSNRGKDYAIATEEIGDEQEIESPRSRNSGSVNSRCKTHIMNIRYNELISRK